MITPAYKYQKTALQTRNTYSVTILTMKRVQKLKRIKTVYKSTEKYTTSMLEIAEKQKSNKINYI